MQAALELVQGVESGVLDHNSLCELEQISSCLDLSFLHLYKEELDYMFSQRICSQQHSGSGSLFAG